MAIYDCILSKFREKWQFMIVFYLNFVKNNIFITFIVFNYKISDKLQTNIKL
jgi:hypothetical protein